VLLLDRSLLNVIEYFLEGAALGLLLVLLALPHDPRHLTFRVNVHRSITRLKVMSGGNILEVTGSGDEASRRGLLHFL